jgi:uncharacterized YceG family protein
MEIGDDEMKQLKIGKALALLLILFIVFMQAVIDRKAEAATQKQYGIVIADQSGSYSFYDLNSTVEGEVKIELTDSGNVMVPLKQLCKLMPVLTYQYDTIKKTATVVNTNNGKKIVYQKNNSYLSYYSGPKAKAAKKRMTYKMYVSKESSSVMVHMSSLKWVMGTEKGYHYYKASDMQKAGYDTLLYSGLLSYNPYNTVTAIPKSTTVKGISSTVKVTIPEGYSVPQVFELLVKKGVCASTDYLYTAMEEYEIGEKEVLAGLIPEDENRIYRFEGYLFPDTYEFYRLSSGKSVISKLLSNLETRITAADREKASQMGYTMDEILRIASMIEKEASDQETRLKVASVIYNRLSIGMKLQLDCNDFYLKRYVRPYIDGDVHRFDIYYDVYHCKALPAGPICNPGRASIAAALNPSVTDYLYFYSEESGEYHFSKDYVNSKATVTLPPVPTQVPGSEATPTPEVTPPPAVTPVP